MPAKKNPARISPLGQSVAEARAKRMRNPEYRAAAVARAKKKRPLRRSYAGVLVPSVSAKKKRPSERQTMEALLLALRVWRELKEQLADAQRSITELRSQLAIAHQTSGERLQAIQKLTDERARDRRADFAEFTYWKGEVERLHHELLEIHREQAREGVS
jgi:hypothetical protein